MILGVANEWWLMLFVGLTAATLVVGIGAIVNAIQIRRSQFTESERHAVAHAEYLVKQANADKPEVCFDYELVATLLRLIERLRKR